MAAPFERGMRWSTERKKTAHHEKKNELNKYEPNKYDFKI